MKLVQFILLSGILFYADTINGQIANTTALDPYLHYINITIRYHDPMILALYHPSTTILPQYGNVLASCYLNISREEVTSTSYSTSDLFVVEITNLNISLFYRSYTIIQFSDENDFGDTIVKFEFYLTQNGTFILATDAIEVFNGNCDTSDWKDSFTSDSISASASFSSKQSSLQSSSLASSSIYTSSLQSISSIGSVVSSHFFTTEPSQQVSAPVSTSPTLLSSVIEVNTTPLSAETTSYVQTQVNPSTDSVASRTVPSFAQSAVPTSLSVPSQPSLIAPITATQYVTADSKSVFESTTKLVINTTGIANTQSDRVIASTQFLAASSSITNVMHTSFLPVLSSSQPAVPPLSSLVVIQAITATQPVTADSVFRSTQFLAPASSSIPNVIRVLSSSQPAIPSQSASSIHRPFQAITSSAVVQIPSQSQQTFNRTIQYSASSSSSASTPTLTLNTSAVSTSMSLFVDSRIIVDLPSTGILGSSLSSPVQSHVTSSAFVPSSSIYSSQHIVQPTRPLVLMSSQTQSIVSLQSSTAFIRQPSFSSSSIRQPIIPSSSIRQPIIPSSSSIQQPIIPSSSSSQQPIFPSSSIQQPIIPSSSIRQPIIPSSSIQQPIIPSSSIRQPIIPSSSIRQPIIPSSSIQQPIIPSSSYIQQPIIPSSSSIRQPIILSSSIQQPIISSSSIQQPIIPSSSISSAINFRLLSSSMVRLSTSLIGAQSSSSSAAIYRTTSLLSAVHSLTSAVSRMLTQTAMLQASSSVRALSSNTSTASQFVVPTHSVPQQPSAVFNTSQLSSTRLINTSIIDRVQSLTTQLPIIPTATPIQSTVLPTAYSVQPTSIPQVSPYRHYLIATIEYTVSTVEIGQTDDNINATITAIAIRYLNLTTQTAIDMYTLTTEHISVRIGDLTVTALRSEYESLTENLATIRVVFYVTDNTAILLARQAKTVLDTYSIDQWAESTGLQTSSVTFDLYGQIQTGSTLIPTMTVSSQLSPSIPVLNTTVISMTSLTTRPVLSTSSTELNLSLIVSSLQPVTSSSVLVSQISTTRHRMLTSLSLPSSSIQTTPILATQSISAPVQLMTSSLRDTLITPSSNRSAFPTPGPTAESPVISMTSSLVSVFNSTFPSQPLVSSIIPTTQAVQPSLAVTSSGISSVQQLRPNATSLPAMATVSSTQFPTSTGFLNASVRVMTSSPIISRIATQTSIISMIQNSSSSQIVSFSSQINTSSLFPTQRVSLAPSPNSSLQQTQTVPPSNTSTGDYLVLHEFNPGAGYLLQLTLNASETEVDLSGKFYESTELDLINLYSLGLEIAEQSVNNRRKRDVFNTTSQIACGIIESLTNVANNRLIIVFYISREENGLPLTFVLAETSIYIFDKLEPSNYTATLGYEFLSLSIYEGIFVDPHRLAIIVGTTLGCCSLVMLIFLVVLCLYHCLHSNYIRADKWSPNMSITYSNKGVYTGSTSKLMNEDEFEMEFTRTNFSEGTQTLARDFLSGSSEITRTSADYAFTLRTEPNLFSPFQVEETLFPVTEATTRSSDETEPSKYPSPLDTGAVPTISQLRTEIEEEKIRAKRAEASLLQIMTSNRQQLAEASVFSDASEVKRAEERASAAYEKSKKELAVVSAAVTPSNSYGSSLDSSRGAHRPWSARGNKVAPSNEPGLTAEPKILDWVPEHQSVSSKSSRPMELSGFRNVRPPNIMQVEPRPILETPPPAYDQSPVETQAKPIPVRVFRTDGHPVQMHPSVPSTPVTSTINVLPSFNPFYTTAKKEHTSL